MKKDSNSKKNSTHLELVKLGKIFYRQNEDLIPYTVLNQSITAETVLEKPVSIDLTVSVLDMQDIFNQVINQ